MTEDINKFDIDAEQPGGETAEFWHEQCAANKQRADKAVDDYVRLLADFDNFKKNKKIEVDNIKRMAKKDLMIDLLPVVDAIYLWEKSNEDAPQGVKNIIKMFMDTLKKNGLEKFGKIGEPFNDALYDAVNAYHADGLEKGIVDDIIKYGFTLNENIIRHAQVVVTN